MVREYTQIIDSYRRMFGMVDAFHFNSQNTADVYAKYLSVPTESKVIPITHSGIKDNRRIKLFGGDVLRLGFIGSETPYKGLPLLKDIIGQLNQEGYMDAISLEIYGGRTGKDKDFPNIFYRGHFTSAMMEGIFSGIDMLVVPSIWHETFSLVTMEALSFGTPVLVSDKVGAKDVVCRYAPNFVYHDNIDLKNRLSYLLRDRADLRRYNKAIIELNWDNSISRHAELIIKELYATDNEKIL